MDRQILEFISEHMHSDWLDVIMKIFTVIGEFGIFGISVGIICLFFKSHRKTAFLMLVVMAIGFLIGNIMLKNLIARPRPCHSYPSLLHYIDMPSGYSFPSGHTLHSFIPAFMFLFNKKFRTGIILTIMAVFIAFSRMYFGVHYPTDILAGIVLAALLVFACMLIVKKSKKLNESLNKLLKIEE